MKRNKDILAVITILCMCITSITGIFSMNFEHAHDFVNQYGHTVKIFGYGIYANDSYFKAPISIGTDFCILFVLVPLFLYTYVQYRKKGDVISEIKLISVYAVAFYYGASIAFGVTYNQIFLVYVVLFTCSLFGMFVHIKRVRIQQKITVTRGLSVFLIVAGIALIVAWMPDIISSLITGETLPLIGVYTTEITYVLDMGIISPLCFVCLYLLKKKEGLGVVLLSILLKLCIIVGIMVIPQTVCQVLSGIEMELPVLATKVLSFVALGGFALYFNKKMYQE
ncbi:MAG: hypothetical protein PUF65_00430 [Lachnospiraceae bacterium]|nr:hypothetical protein [Lachnospiraceae bacterium]